MLRAGQREIWCKAINVSENGILLYPQGAGSTPQTSVHVVFTLPSLSSWIELEGRLVRQDKVNRRRAWGVAFSEVPADSLKQLRHFVTEHFVPRTSLPPPLPDINVPTPLAADGRASRTTAPLRKQVRSKVSSTDLMPIRPGVSMTTGQAVSISQVPPSRGSVPVVDLCLDDNKHEPDTRKVPSEEVERLAQQEDEPTRRTREDETTGLRARCRRS